VAFRFADDRPDAPALRHLRLGMNAHINYHPQALFAVISDARSCCSWASGGSASC
jgi:hypothetical protein